MNWLQLKREERQLRVQVDETQRMQSVNDILSNTALQCNSEYLTHWKLAIDSSLESLNMYKQQKQGTNAIHVLHAEQQQQQIIDIVHGTTHLISSSQHMDVKQVKQHDQLINAIQDTLNSRIISQ